MHIRMATIKIKPEHRDKFVAAMIRDAKDSRAGEPDCLDFTVVQDERDPNRIFLYEVYRNSAAFDAHVKGPTFTRWRNTVAEWFDKTPDSVDADEVNDGVVTRVGINVYPSDTEWKGLDPAPETGQMNRVKVLLSLLGVLAAAVVLTIWGVMSGRIFNLATGRDEFLKFLFAVLQVELVGIVLWVAQEEYKRSRAKADEARSRLVDALRAISEARRSYLEDTARRLRKAYAEVKRCRRVLKAQVAGTLTENEGFNVSRLDVSRLYSLGEALMEPQLELEGLKWEAIGAAGASGLMMQGSAIPGMLTKMESYANGLSKALMRFSTPPKEKHVEVLRDCVGPYEDSTFEAQFGRPYDILTETLMRERAISGVA